MGQHFGGICIFRGGYVDAITHPCKKIIEAGLVLVPANNYSLRPLMLAFLGFKILLTI
jgi:hypothetical protein